MIRIAACVAVAALACVPAADAQSKSSPELRYAVIIARHGVRAPTWTPERLNRYSATPWPDFGVPPGHLTPHGRSLMKILGSFYREYFTAEGLLGKPNCGD